MSNDPESRGLGDVTPQDVARYLRSRGWRRHERTWRGASVWSSELPGADELLLPLEIRYRDDPRSILRVIHSLAAVEERPLDDVVRDISQPLVDKQHFRTHPDTPTGTTPLLSGATAVEGVRLAFTSAARSVIDHNPGAARGRRSKGVDRFLRSVRLGPSAAGSYILTAQVPIPASSGQMTMIGTNEPEERRVVRHLFSAVRAAGEATRAAEDDEAARQAFDDTVEQGVTSQLCDALASLGGYDHDHAFAVGFSWAPGMPSGLEQQGPVEFGPRAARVLRAAGERLRDLEYEGGVRLRGTIVATERDSPQEDGFVKVRGHFTTYRSSGNRTVRVRLSSRDYAAALAAHERGDPVEVHGRLSTVQGRRELQPDGFRVRP